MHPDTMENFEELVHSEYEHIMNLNFKLFSDNPDIPQNMYPNMFNRQRAKHISLPTFENFNKYLFSILPETVIDKTSLQLMEIGNLFMASNHTTTSIGASTLFRSLIQPPTSLELITAKQESLQELESNDKLRNSIEDYLQEFAPMEEYFFSFAHGLFAPMEQHGRYRKFRKAVRKLDKVKEKIPEPESKYLKTLTSDLISFNESEIFRLMRGPVYRTILGLQSKEKRNFLIPRMRYYPYLINHVNVLPSLPVASTFFTERAADGTVYWIKAAEQYLSMPQEVSLGLGMAGVMFSLMYVMLMKLMVDNSSVTGPLVKRMKNSNELSQSFDSLGKLDEILSFSKYAKSMPVEMSLPRLTDQERHYFIAQDLRNPILAKESSDFVSNHIRLCSTYLTVITGPNSGGKTTICKSVAQSQILGQIGCYVPATNAYMNIADRIFYQAPSFDALNDPEGRFGTELAITRDIFYATTPKSLVILDELAEGTTIEEKLEQSYGIIDDFYLKKNNTVWVTHNHEVAERFKQESKGQFLQVEFNGYDPTHELVEGISKVSHADRVAKKIGFSAEDRRKHLIEGGYLK